MLKVGLARENKTPWFEEAPMPGMRHDMLTVGSRRFWDEGNGELDASPPCTTRRNTGHPLDGRGREPTCSAADCGVLVEQPSGGC
jgi:hypothetical protein